MDYNVAECAVAPNRGLPSVWPAVERIYLDDYDCLHASASRPMSNLLAEENNHNLRVLAYRP